MRRPRRYSRLYNAAIKDSAFGYALFFAGFFANLVFSIWSAVGACLLASGMLAQLPGWRAACKLRLPAASACNGKALAAALGSRDLCTCCAHS